MMAGTLPGESIRPMPAGPPRREYRDVHGVLLLDKPMGMTSNQALQEVKHLFKARKAGHTGSLDPLATGLLPLCFGEATKVSAFLLDADKVYVVDCCLGTRTATADAEGAITETRVVPVLDTTRIEQALARFRGDILQVPPMYSALRHQGQRLYDLAREGIEVAREPRPVTIRELELLTQTADSLQLRVHCSKGTYIRTLVEDIAAALGTCGHVTALRRVSVGSYGQTRSMYTLSALRDQALHGTVALDVLLLPVDSAVAQWPAARLGEDAAWYFARGQAVQAPGAPSSGWVRVYGGVRFVGLGEILPDGRVAPRRILNTAGNAV